MGTTSLGELNEILLLMQLNILLSNFNSICFVWIGVAAATFCLLQFVTAPFGRHASDSWGPTINNKTGWVLFEIVSLIAFVLSSGLLWTTSINHLNSCQLIVAASWTIHYMHRSLIYPLNTKT